MDDNSVTSPPVCADCGKPKKITRRGLCEQCYRRRLANGERREYRKTRARQTAEKRRLQEFAEIGGVVIQRKTENQHTADQQERERRILLYGGMVEREEQIDYAMAQRTA